MCYVIIVTGFGKTNHLHNFIVMRNINLKNSLSYNLAIVSSRSMRLALEIKHDFSFKQRGLIIADNLPCLILGGFYWHGCNIRSGTYKEWVGGRRMVAIEKRHPEASLAPPICQTSHHTSHKPQQMRLTRSLTVCTGFSVFHMDKKKPSGKADLATSFYFISVF